MAEQDKSSANEVAGSASSRISVLEIARRLDIGRLAVYSMLEKGIIPGLRLGRRWIITRQAYLSWESTCGVHPGTGLRRPPEVDVVN
jgi:excisionase family DNA binding protein